VGKFYRCGDLPLTANERNWSISDEIPRPRAKFVCRQILQVRRPASGRQMAESVDFRRNPASAGEVCVSENLTGARSRNRTKPANTLLSLTLLGLARSLLRFGQVSHRTTSTYRSATQ